MVAHAYTSTGGRLLKLRHSRSLITPVDECFKI